FSAGRTLALKNDTANWITVADINAGTVKINDKTIMLEPFSTQTVNTKSVVERQYELTIIDDSGNYISSKVHVK
ncbi:fimbrial biogenesis chaperone, partial [Salmonella enterica]